MGIKVNKYQTQLTDELIQSLNEEVRSDLLDYINNIEFIQRLISPDRRYASDMSRNSSGKIIVDLCNPHILEDMDYFRQTAIHFEKYECYTKLIPNPNPQSDFNQWLKREVFRCWNGMTRESDGEWITGELYFYMNYFPIMVAEGVDNTDIATFTTQFPKMWEGVYWRAHYMHQARNGGLYNDFHGGKHCVEIARRGASKSYFLASVLTRILVVGESEIERTKTRGLVSSYSKEYLSKDGILNKFWDGAVHCAKHTQFPSAKLKKSWSELSWVMGFYNENGDEDGTLNEVLGVAVADDVNKIRGKRSKKMIYEEFGMYPKFLDVWQISLSNVQSGKKAFGQAYAIGTGGTEGSDFQGAMEMINHPDGYNVYSLPNYWDKGAHGQKKTIFFFPGYINSIGHYNKDGVSDVIGALIEEIQIRIQLKYNSSDPLQLTRRKAETAFTIQDAIMKRDGSLYPSDKLNDVINDINMNPKYTDDMWIGRLKMGSDGIVEYKLDNDLKYITEFPHKDNKLEGAICIKHMPVKDSSGRVPWGRYISGADVYDDDSSDTLSLFSMFILDLWTDELVFEYTGRPMFADDAYENCRLALLMYNAECNYENNKKGLFGYFSKMNSLYLLSDTLDFLKDKEMVKGGMYGNKSKGSGNYGTVAPYGRRCYRDYLLKPEKTIVTEEVDGKFEEKVITTLGLNKIWSKGLLQETSSWNADGNFDRHDAMIMLMLLREDKLRLLGNMSAKDAINNRDIGYLGKDKFFEKNYKRGIVSNSKLFEI